ncbi:hypothetical protein MJT46_019120 [Ovis ammon polii x Ovis aries]|nr:hypothetical protein MJT46_019120 [Ovis ammon polii x Ovis aries]
MPLNLARFVGRRDSEARLPTSPSIHSTPNIDRLAREGVRLTQHLAAASMCTPSRAAFLTGRYPVRSGMASSSNLNRDVVWLGGSGGLPPNETTFAKLLQHRGYRTGLIGKWHQGLSCASRDDHCYHPLNHGFDYFYGMPFELLSDCQGFHTPELHRQLRVQLWVCTVVLGLIPLLLLVPTCARWFLVPWPVILAFALLALVFFVSWFSSYGFTRRWNCVLMRDHEIIQQPVRLERLASLMLKEALAFIDRYKRGPFLLFISFLHVHTPLVTKEKFVGHSKFGLYGDNVEEMDWMERSWRPWTGSAWPTTRWSTSLRTTGAAWRRRTAAGSWAAGTGATKEAEAWLDGKEASGCLEFSGGQQSWRRGRSSTNLQASWTFSRRCLISEEAFRHWAE